MSKEARVNRILKPGDTDYAAEIARLSEGLDLTKIAKDMKVDEDTKLTGEGAAVQFEYVTMPTPRSPDMLLEHGVDRSGKTTHKLIFHFKNVALNDMAELGRAMAEICANVVAPMPGNVYASAGRNEIYRSNWDFIVWGVPAMRSPALQVLIIQAAQSAFRG